ncbi:MAG: T9SS type A sorting domain-containing protein [Saprospiraceae bacterium]|nr:T9SS type A sorting domain-containing protein [Saprospiraceae bacterium]
MLSSLRFRGFYLALIIVFTSSIVGVAQIMEIPLGNNPILERHVSQESLLSRAIQEEKSAFTRSTAHCIASGSSITLCIDTAGLGTNATITLTNCAPLAFGSVTLDSTCVTYQATAGLISGQDLVCVEVCKTDGSCTTSFFDFTIHRPSLFEIVPSQVLNAGESFLYCITPDPALNTPLYRLSGDITRPNGKVITLAECMRFEANRKAGSDIIYYLAQYDECLTDTFAISITVNTDTIAIPFFDDFNYPGPYPDPAKWVDDQAFINKTMAYQPVSLGVATLDGLDQFGRSYPESPNKRDTLTSAYLDLSPYTENDILLLTFRIQRKGLGFAPETNDSLIVEFKNNQEEWVLADRIPGLNPFQSNPDTFINRTFGLADEDFLYKGFQFRFRNKSKLTGALGLWHIAYVQLEEDQSVQGNNLDITFTRQPNYLISRYTAMPWRHFHPVANSWLSPSLDIGLFNHHTEILTANPSEVVISDLISGQVFVSNINLLDLPPTVPQNQLDLAPGRHDFLNPLSTSGLAGALQSLSPNLEAVELNLQFRFEQNLEENAGEPVALRNNTTNRTTVLSNYFAYDDGTAESAIVATKAGTQVAMAFQATIQDTLRAIQFHFPRYNVDVTTQFFNLRIWTGSLNNDPVYEDFFLKPFYPDLLFEDSLQGFTTYVLFDNNGNAVGVPIPAGTFYVGWQQGSNVDDPIPVGFDKNILTGADYSWLNTSGTWQPFPGSLRGSLMIHPVFGDKTPNHTPDLVDLSMPHELMTTLNLYPNPSNGAVWLDAGIPSEDWTITIIDALGRTIATVPYTSMMDLSGANAGLYQLVIRDAAFHLLARRTILLER